MRTLAAFVFLVACEKSGPVETTPGVVEATVQPPGPTPTRVTPTIATTADELAGELAHAPEPADSPRARRERERENMIVMAELDARRFVDLLTSETTTRNVLDDMSRRRPMADLGSVDLGRSNVVVGGGTGGTGRASRGDLDGGAKTDSPGPNTSSVGRVTVSPLRAADTTSLTSEMVLRKVASAYVSGIKRCYKTSLAQDPALRGKLALKLKIIETGRTTDASVTGLTKPLDDCIAAQMTSWRFPIPKDNDGDPTEATFEIAIHLVPE